ncbi:Phenolic acid decarboxylase subunit B [Pseudovibrio axinellae]|uniref:Flavin prenyltransferase UbiX n=1 Tax=Pseudovibrio axinellae TaxID=989403 RepID=A0A165YVV3_9HYPH|nr:UbiX family flavin prenyltransferase [Pseudovibrio axinellae]KZL19281.1 Phenolic acid decarboxylase subunit B [Pseudovibrio axinellae]SEQ43029.1 4-hydroxy-3-polyprenylbenzoate decarboxylase [Pseudovibrio axinellae]
MTKRIIVGVSGASGAQLALKTLEILKALNVETHLVHSKGAVASVQHELGDDGIEQLKSLASVTYGPNKMTSAIASGSFHTDGMIITPCSMRTLSGVAYSFSDNLLSRAADVILKERRKLVLVPRETPLHEGHLEAMLKVTRMGAIIAPPVPPFYADMKNATDLLKEVAARGIHTLGIDPGAYMTRWK